MSRLIHLNGPPGIGKSTLARRYAADHPGVLNCDIDALRTFIGGWEDDWAEAGSLIRPAALAMIGAYLASGHDVVLPQMLINPVQVDLFSGSATGVGAEFVERFLMDSASSSVDRFARRGADSTDPWNDQVRTIVADNGGEDELRRCHEGLSQLLLSRPAALVIESVEGSVDQTYETLVSSLG